MSLLADAVAVLHFGFLAFVVVGGFLCWRWPRLLWAHVPAAAWGLYIVLFDATCPLTTVENALRRRGGEPELAGGFIDTYVEGVLYPERFVAQARLLAAAAVLIAWVGLVVLYKRRAQRPLVQRHGDG